MGLRMALRERRIARQITREARAEVALRMNPPQPDQVTKTGRSIDMRQGARYWGHDFVMTSDTHQEGLLRGHIWVTPGAQVGDDLRWTGKGPDGKGADRIGRLVYVRPMGDPNDMYEVFVRVVGRQEEGTG